MSGFLSAANPATAMLPTPPRRVCAVVLLCVGVTAAVAPAADPPPEFAALKYRLLGPFAGGRVSRACGVPGDPLTYFAATAGGGVWKSADGGVGWKPVFDDEPTASVGSIAVAPSDPNVVYVGTGEANIRGNVSPGAGIFKSTDGGATWKHVWKQVGQIGTVAVHPTNPDVAFAAVLGHAFGPNPERGVYRTKDGGKTWDRVLAKDENTGASDVAIDPGNPRVVFAGLWQARRRPWEMTSGGPGSDLAVSRDGGDTWTTLKADAKKNGLPDGVWGKIGVAVAPSDSARVYALIEAEKGGLFRSDDGGTTWAKATDDRHLRQRAWYFSTLTVDPKNPDVVFAPQVELRKSIDGGKTFAEVKGPHHADHHDLWIDPTNPKRMIAANDGGVDISLDGGKSWTAPPLPVSQFYHVHADNHVPFRVMGNMQDLGTARGPSHALTDGGIPLGDWHKVGGGETGSAVPDPADPDVVYAGEYSGILTRYDHRTRQARNVSVLQTNPSGVDPVKMKYRFQWTAPVVVSVHDPKTVYHAANVVFRTRDGGHTWDAVSPDLTRDDKTKQQWSGGPITGDNTGVEIYGTVFALAESPKKAGVLWAGTDDGRVHVSLDAGKSWLDRTAAVPDLPEWGTVSCVEPSPHDPAAAFLVVDNHRTDDYRPHVWKTTDSGKTWAKISAGLDAGTHLHVVREDPRRKGHLYLGTERGVQFSPDAGATWRPLKLNLPTAAVHDLVVKDDSLVVGTHGRSLWVLDDLTVVRNWAETLRAKPAHLFPVVPATRWFLAPAAVSAHHKKSAAKNPPKGVPVWLWCAAEPKDPVAVEVTDSAGNVIAKATGKPLAGKAPPDDEDEPADDDDEKDDKDDEDAEKAGQGGTKGRTFPVRAGLSRFVWDLTHDGAEKIPDAHADLGDPDAKVPVSPGSYVVRVTVGKETLTTTVEVRADPRWLAAAARPAAKLPPDFAPKDFANLSPREQEVLREYLAAGRGPDADAKAVETLVAQEKLALRVRDGIDAVTDTVRRIRAIKKQLDLRKELLKDRPDAKDLLAGSAAVGDKFAAIEAKLHNPKAKVAYDILAQKGGAMLYSQLTWLLTSLTDGDGRPTLAQTDLAAELGTELAGLLADFDAAVADDIAKLNAAARKLGVPEVYVPPSKKRGEKPAGGK